MGTDSILCDDISKTDSDSIHMTSISIEKVKKRTLLKLDHLSSILKQQWTGTTYTFSKLSERNCHGCLHHLVEQVDIGHQTWRAGKWTIEISDFLNATSIQFGDFPTSHV